MNSEHINHWIQKSSIMSGKRFASFTLNKLELTKEIKPMIYNYIKEFDHALEGGYGLYFYSASPGSGKTTCMRAVAVELLKLKHQVLFDSMIEFKAKLKHEFDEKQTGTIMDSMKSIRVLGIDDLGSEYGSKWLDEVMKEVIDHRYNNSKVLLITSNLPIKRLPFDEKIKDRLRGMCKEIHFPEKSFRKLGI